jgi:hypothetical protein
MNAKSETEDKHDAKPNPLTVIYFAVTGFITIPLALWFASGTIAESQTNASFPAPQFLWLIAIWMLGLVINYFSKFFWIGLIISFLPVGYFIYRVLYPIFM